MAIPDFQTIMLPFLRFASDGAEHSMKEVREAIAKEFELSEEDLSEMIPSGRQNKFYNRVAWAKVYLGKAGLLESPGKGIFLISAKGLEVLKKPPAQITIKFLKQFPEFKLFRSRKKSASKKENVKNKINEMATPEETLGQGYQQLRDEVASELLQMVKSCSPKFFEKLVVELLLKMGYGGWREDAGKTTGKTSDEGIDGIINEDKLGLDVIYIQAKRWEDTVVGRPEIQKFVGALQGQQAKKGVFITTSSFSKGAEEFAEKVESKIVLIDGDYLAELMISHNVGVSTVETYEIKKIDSDYFIDE